MKHINAVRRGDDKEVDETDWDRSDSTAGDTKLHSDFRHAVGDEWNKESGADHGERIEAGKPGNHDGGETLAADETGAVQKHTVAFVDRNPSVVTVNGL